MGSIRTNRWLRPFLAFTLLAALGLLALGCEPAPSFQNTGAAVAPPAQESQTAADATQNQDKTGPGYIHNLPIGTEADVGYQVGEYVPAFTLQLIDGQTVTATRPGDGGETHLSVLLGRHLRGMYG